MSRESQDTNPSPGELHQHAADPVVTVATAVAVEAHTVDAPFSRPSMNHPSQPPQQPSDVVGMLLKNYWGPIVGLVSFIAMLAISSSSIHSMTVAQEALTTELRTVSHRIDEHERVPWHPVMDGRVAKVTDAVQVLDNRVTQIEVQQRTVDRETRQQLDAINRNIVALCAATRGAMCLH